MSSSNNRSSRLNVVIGAQIGDQIQINTRSPGTGAGRATLGSKLPLIRTRMTTPTAISNRARRHRTCIPMSGSNNRSSRLDVIMEDRINPKSLSTGADRLRLVTKNLIRKRITDLTVITSNSNSLRRPDVVMGSQNRQRQPINPVKEKGLGRKSS
jgi:hypothetical protein